VSDAHDLPPDAMAACAALRGLRGRVLLHSARDDDELGDASFLAALPSETLLARGRALVRLAADGRASRRWTGDPVRAVAEFLEEHGAGLDRDDHDQGARVLGYLGYDLGRSIEALERGPRRGDDCPDVWLGAYPAVMRYDRAGARWLGSSAARQRLAAALTGRTPPIGPAPSFGPLVADDSGDHHRARIERVLDYLSAGDVYQVNLARRHVARQVAPGDALALYRALAQHAPAPYGGVLEADGVTLLSSSPERFLRVHAGRVETRPIKGTRPRAADPATNRARAEDLAAADKDSAEHLMIVDLERNDLGRVAATGSVTVDALGYIVEFATVLHRVSRISARLAAGIDHAALLRATFPGGSVTGAPKVRAMQIIDELEPAPRGPYCGALGIFGPGSLDLALSIRVGVLVADELRLHVGGGIVADSDPAAELAETEDKLAGWRRTLAALR
jgi:para-aminobenzoate synthetase component I